MDMDKYLLTFFLINYFFLIHTHSKVGVNFFNHLDSSETETILISYKGLSLSSFTSLKYETASVTLYASVL